MKKMKMMRDYICLENVKAKADIIRYEEILRDNPSGKSLLFGESIDINFLAKEIKRLKKMLYCRNCENRKDCVMYQTRKDNIRR